MNDDQWPEVLDLAIHHGLAPMLNWVLKEKGVNPKTDPRWSPINTTVRDTALEYVLLDTTRVRLDAALKDAVIPSIWLKGIALSHHVYPRPWLRPMGDLDVLIPFTQRKLALTVAESIGFHTPQKKHPLTFDLPENLEHHYVLSSHPIHRICLELHYRLLGSDTLNLLPTLQLEWFWENSYTLANDGSQITVFKPEPKLLYLCAHAILQHGEANWLLLRYFDLHLLITKTVMDWQIVVDKALELKWSYAVERALKLTIKYFNTPVPDWVLGQLQNRRSPDENIFRVVRLQGKGARWESELILLSKLPFLDRLHRTAAMVFPPKEFLQERYAVPPGKPVLPYYFYRWFDISREIVWSTRNRLLSLF